MVATFDIQRLHEPVVVLKPDNATEAILLAAWMGFDSNSFSVSVERAEDGRIKQVMIEASQIR